VKLKLQAPPKRASSQAVAVQPLIVEWNYRLATMTKRAVLIGCNYTHTDPSKNLQLQGCVNDAELFKGVLIQKFGFKEEDITMLIDREMGSSFPTAANIKVRRR
jgi:hypothetical protein